MASWQKFVNDPNRSRLIRWIGVLGAIASILGLFYIFYPPSTSIYRVRVTVIDSQQIPVEDAQVWSSMGGEPKKVTGGWQFDIPQASMSKDGKVTFYALKRSAFLFGKHDLLLGDDSNPAIIIQLHKDTSAIVRGIVVDNSNRAISGARVCVVGYEIETITTGTNGNFVLSAHAADGQQVQLHAEKKGYKPANQLHPAGDEPATIILERE